MGFNDRIDTRVTRIVKCKFCGKQYRQKLEEQTPGFRMEDYDKCPYCGKENGVSMEVEFSNEKIDD